MSGKIDFSAKRVKTTHCSICTKTYCFYIVYTILYIIYHLIYCHLNILLLMHIIIDCIYHAADIQVVKGKYCVSITIFIYVYSY